MFGRGGTDFVLPRGGGRVRHPRQGVKRGRAPCDNFFWGEGGDHTTKIRLKNAIFHVLSRGMLTSGRNCENVCCFQDRES